MDRGRGGANNFFASGDPFGGFGIPGNLMSSFFGGSDPFDHPFFNSPFRRMNGPSMFGQMNGPRMFGQMNGPGMFGQSMLGPGLFGSRGDGTFGEVSNPGFLEQAPQTNMSRGPIIQELDSDAEEEGEKDDNELKQNPKKRIRSSRDDPYVQHPDEETEEKRSRLMPFRFEPTRTNATQPQSHTFIFQSSTVTYGGANGAYYTSSETRRTDGDGVTVEESREADTTTGRATHRISRGLRNKGHSVTRKLNSDGRVDTLQTLHNLNEDELPAFEQAWKGNARQHLPVWNPGADVLDNVGSGSGNNGRQEQGRGWALPSNSSQ